MALLQGQVRSFCRQRRVLNREIPLALRAYDLAADVLEDPNAPKPLCGVHSSQLASDSLLSPVRTKEVIRFSDSFILSVLLDTFNSRFTPLLPSSPTLPPDMMLLLLFAQRGEVGGPAAEEPVEGGEADGHRHPPAPGGEAA